MKKLLLLFSLLLIVSAASANLIVNPGFEGGVQADGVPNDWVLYAPLYGTVYKAVKTDPVYDGTYSFKFLARQGYGLLHQTIDVTGGQSLSFWLYGHGDNSANWTWNEGDSVDVSMKFKDASGSAIDEISTVLFDNDASTDAPDLSYSEWLKSSVFSFFTPENTAQVQVKIRIVDGDYSTADGASFYMDNVTLVPEPATLALLGIGGLLTIRRRKH